MPQRSLKEPRDNHWPRAGAEPDPSGHPLPIPGCQTQPGAPLCLGHITHPLNYLFGGEEQLLITIFLGFCCLHLPSRSFQKRCISGSIIWKVKLWSETVTSPLFISLIPFGCCCYYYYYSFWNLCPGFVQTLCSSFFFFFFYFV